MKTKMHIPFLCAVILAVGGCRSVSTRVDLSPTHYTVTAMILELSKEAEPPLGNTTQSSVDSVTKRWDTKTTRLPTVHLLLGETKEIEEGDLHTYPIEFDSDGKPTKHETVRDGLSIRATLSITHDNRPKLAIVIVDSKIIKWSISPAGNKSPVCKIRRINTTVHPNWGEWQNVGMAAATEKDKEQMFLVRIDKPNKKPSNH